MNTGLLTFHAAHHYGAQLQAYALQKAVEKCGSACEIIDYVREDTEQAKKLFRSGLSPRSLLANTHTVLHYGALGRRAERFERFVAEDMRLSAKRYATYEALALDAPVYDAYVLGSDQIWNPLIFKERQFDPAFFAAFARSGRRIAYAPSFGIPEMPQAYKETLRGYLEGFSALSVRERNGEAILRDACARESVTVLDPTLLLDRSEWGRIAAAPGFAGPYLLCYFISDPTPYASLVRALAEKLKLPVVSLCGARRTVPRTERIVLDAGPREFLGLFANASHVLTDSFHGTVFSVNFGRPFHSLSLASGGKRKVSSRLESILGILGLSERLIVEAGAEVPLEPMDQEGIAGRLAGEREKSLSWLQEALFAPPQDVPGAKERRQP